MRRRHERPGTGDIIDERGEPPVLIRLLRTYLRPYKRPLTAVVLLQFVGTMASLYLPSLNADIIDNGVAKGDTGYILRTGGWMLVVTAVQIVCSIVAVYFGARTAMRFGRDVRAARLPPGRDVLRPGGRPLRRAVADHPHHQRRAAGADAGRDDLHDARGRADHVRRRRRHGDPRGRRPVLADGRERAGPGAVDRPDRPRMVPQFRQMQERIDTVNRVLREQIAGIRVVRAFVREPHEAGAVRRRQRRADRHRPAGRPADRR